MKDRAINSHKNSLYQKNPLSPIITVMTGTIEPKKDLSAYQALLEIDEKERSYAARQGYAKAYVLSILLPPIGFYYFFKYVIIGSGSPDETKAGITSLILTIVALILTIALPLVLFRQASSTLPVSSGNMIQELITPANQDTLKKLFQ